MQNINRRGSDTMNRLSRLTLVFAMMYTVLLISPAFLNRQFAPYSLIKYGDVTDLFTPVILMPLYWFLFRLNGSNEPTRRESLFFLVGAAIWVEGHGLHLSSNSIGHLLARSRDSNAYALTYFYDEVLSHYIWHFGVIGLSALIIFRQWQHPFADAYFPLRVESIAGLIYGMTYSITTIEAGTVPLGLPFAISAAALILISKRNYLWQQPLLAFFLVAYAVASILLIAWGIYWRGFPQFSEIGIIQ